MKRPHWLRSALTDEAGLFDVAYISLGGVSVLVLGSITFVCAMAFLDWLFCEPITEGGKVLLSCRFDADGVGNAVAKICGAYAAALTALGVYMATTRKPKE